jgi:hypothetical protein
MIISWFLVEGKMDKPLAILFDLSVYQIAGDQLFVKSGV